MDPAPEAILADFAYVASRTQRDVTANRRSVAEATETPAAACEIVTRLLVSPSSDQTTPVHPLSRHSYAC